MGNPKSAKGCPLVHSLWFDHAALPSLPGPATSVRRKPKSKGIIDGVLEGTTLWDSVSKTLSRLARAWRQGER